MIQVKLSSAFQLPIPKALCEDLNLQVGQQFTIVTRGSIIELIPTPSIREARGMLLSSVCGDSSDYRDRIARNFL